jgi:hypothetical protein
MNRSLKQPAPTSGVRALAIFVQRWEPSFIDKWSRTRCPHLAPTCCCNFRRLISGHNAGTRIGSVDLMAYDPCRYSPLIGMEDPEAPLETLAWILLEEPDTFKKSKSRLDCGFPTPSKDRRHRALAARAERCFHPPIIPGPEFPADHRAQLPSPDYSDQEDLGGTSLVIFRAFAGQAGSEHRKERRSL